MRCAETEMQAAVVHRQDKPDCAVTACACLTPYVAITVAPMALRFDFDAEELDLQPVPPPLTSLRNRDGGSFIVHDQDVHIAIVIEIAEGARRGWNAAPRSPARPAPSQLLELAAAQVAEQHPRRLESG